jgi:hypothetical protein
MKYEKRIYFNISKLPARFATPAGYKNRWSTLLLSSVGLICKQPGSQFSTTMWS